MKMDLDWHRTYLKHQQASLQRSERELLAYQARVDRDRDRVEFLQRQIEVAEGKGKDGFDSERFLLSERPESIR